MSVCHLKPEPLQWLISYSLHIGTLTWVRRRYFRCWQCSVLHVLHSGRAAALVVRGEKAERAELSQSRTTGAGDLTKTGVWTKGDTTGHFSSKLTSMYKKNNHTAARKILNVSSSSVDSMVSIASFKLIALLSGFGLTIKPGLLFRWWWWWW